MNKRIIIAALAVAVLLLGGLTLGRVMRPALSPEEIAAVRTEAWSVYQAYLAALKNRDLPALEATSYQLSAVCRDATQAAKCNELMDNAYFFGEDLDLETLKHTAADDKQVILYGDYGMELSTTTMSSMRGIIYFARDEAGILKVLSLSPFDGIFIIRTNQATSTLETRAREMTHDLDGDTLPDESETCSGNAPQECEKTNPRKKDTNGNGWWDSIENLFYTK